MLVRLIAASFAILFCIGAAEAADPAQCLNREQRRAVMANGHLVPLAKALKTAGAGRGEVVRARLCAGTKGYTYLLTLLARDGKVTFATIDAESGKLAEGR